MDLDKYKKVILPWRKRVEHAERRVALMEEALMDMARDLAKERRLKNETSI